MTLLISSVQLHGQCVVNHYPGISSVQLHGQCVVNHYPGTANSDLMAMIKIQLINVFECKFVCKFHFRLI